MRIAGPEEVKRAIAALSAADLLRLRQFANARIRRIGYRAAHGRTACDLLNEAVTRTLAGTRRWKPAHVEFVKFLLGVMRSISTSWATHHNRNRQTPEYAPLEGDLVRDPRGGNQESVLTSVTTQDQSAAEQMITEEESRAAKRLADEIEAAFEDDEDALTVILGLYDGMPLREIRDDLGWEDKKVRAVMRRIKRRAKKIADRLGDGYARR